MESQPTPPARFQSEASDSDLGAYRSLSVAALVAFLFGLASPLAFLAQILWGIPLAAVACSLWALTTIARNDSVAGRPFAVAGLCLGLFFGSAAVSHRTVRRHWVREDARECASAWFDLLAHDQPHYAHQLTVPLRSRLPLDESIWDAYRDQLEQRDGFEQFVDQPLIRTLLALGQNAELHYWATTRQAHHDRIDELLQVYAVTYKQDGKRHTFFTTLHLVREPMPTHSASAWRVNDFSESPVPVQLK